MCIFSLIVFQGSAVSQDTIIESPVKAYNQSSMAKSLLLSTIYPGLGVYQMDNNKSNLLVGGVGYACLLGSYMFHNKAVNHYDSYLLEHNVTERNKLYNDWSSEKKLSNGFAISAGVVWVANLVWTGLKSKEYRTSTYEEIGENEPVISTSYINETKNTTTSITTTDTETYQSKSPDHTKTTEVVNMKQQSKGKPFLQSVIYPGWGAYTITGKKGYLVLGGLAYGSLVTSYFYYNKAVTSYDNYLVEKNQVLRSDLADEWEQQVKIYKIAGIAAASIWLLELLHVTLLDYNSEPTVFFNNKFDNLSLDYVYNPLAQAPELKLTIQF